MKTKGWLAGLTCLFLAIITMSYTTAETITVKGMVTDADVSEPIIGVSVVIKNTTTGTVTDIDGGYSIEAKKGDVLVFSFIGYVTQEVTVKSEKHDVSLEADQQTLDDVVVVAGYNAQKKAIVTGAISANFEQSAAPGRSAYSNVSPYDYSNSEEYSSIKENRFRKVADAPLSTFSIDVDAASYSNVRRYLNQGVMPPADAIRTEELVNYFSYNYDQPAGNDPVNISTEVGGCPWNNKHRLVRIGIKAREIADKELPASNLVFLIDVSGSMYGPTRLELVKSSLKLLINNLREKDKVAIVVYSGSAGEVLPSTSGSDKQKIREALDNLTAGGSTAGGAGIKLAYKIAHQNFIKDGNNRIILCSDGDFNVGVSSTEGLEEMIERERKSGVFLTVLGYGMGNYKDNRMQVLAEKGNGNHAYIDNMQEANKVLVEEFGGTMYAVAKDVKLQIEFNPAQVQAYRLVGYESRLLNDEDFNDDTKDAGEMGAGHVVTAFYEVVPQGVESNFNGKIDDLKYQKNKKVKPVAATGSKELLTIKLRYKLPDGDTSKKMEIAVIDDKSNRVSQDFNFAASVAMFSQLLRESEYTTDATYDKVIALAQNGIGGDEQGYRKEFIRMVKTVKGLAK